MISFALAIQISLMITTPTFTADDLFFLAGALDGGLPDVAGVPYTMTFFDENGTNFATLNASE